MLSSERMTKSLPLIVIVGACLVRVIICFQHNPMDFLYSDMLRHWHNGGNFPRGGYTAAADPIGYQIYVFFLRKLTFDNRILVAFASALMSLLMPWTFYKSARELGFAKVPALWVWALIAVAPSLFTMYHFLLMETLLLLVEGFALWMTGRYLRKGGTGPLLDCVAAWTFACLTKTTVIPLAAACVLWVLWKKSPPWRDVVIAAVVALLLLVPQAIRTKIELGFIAPFGNPWLTRIQHRSGAKAIRLNFHGPYHDDNQQEYMSPTCLIRPLWPLSSWAIRRAYEHSVVSVTADYIHGSRDWSNAYKSLDIDADEWLAQWRENIVVAIFAPSWPESAWQQLWDSRLEFCARWMWAPLIVLILGCNARTFLQRRFALLPVAVTLFALALLLQNIATAEGRYRKPLEPLLLMNGVWILVNWRTSQNKRIATGLHKGRRDEGCEPGRLRTCSSNRKEPGLSSPSANFRTR